jgi:hypothetical protein
MNRRKIAPALATICALAPVISAAAPENAALNACARAFAASLASPGAGAPAYKVAYGGDHYVGSVAAFYSREYTFNLSASDKKTGMVIAQASCAADKLGAVIALTPRPLTTGQSSIAARL